MSDVQVIGLPQSNFVWAVRIALAEKGVEHEIVPAPPHSPDVLAVHPLGKIPVLRHGEVALGESRVIIDDVDTAFNGPPLAPVDPDAARANETWTSIVATSIEPLFIRQYVFAYMFPGTPDGQPDRAAIDALLPKVEAALDVLEDAVSSGAIGGEAFGRVDAYLVPILFYLRNMPEGGPMLAGRPRLTAYLDQSLARPSVQSTMPPPRRRAGDKYAAEYRARHGRLIDSVGLLDLASVMSAATVANRAASSRGSPVLARNSVVRCLVERPTAVANSSSPTSSASRASRYSIARRTRESPVPLRWLGGGASGGQHSRRFDHRWSSRAQIAAARLSR